MTAKIIYNGDLRCTSTHLQSQSSILTDAPTDNEGRGEAFSPTDLVTAALGTCALTTMGIVARRKQINMDGATAEVTKIMVSDPRRRIAEIIVKITMPANGYTEVEQKILEKAAHACPVAASLHPDLKQTVEISWT